MNTFLKTLLLVEDDTVTAKAQIRLLKKEGFGVVHVSNGRDAIETMRARAGAVQMILMDVDLGEGIDGAETAQEILKEHDVPVVFLSSHTGSSVIKRTEKVASYGYIQKNTAPTVIIASISMAFKLHEAHRQLIEKEHSVRASEKRLRMITDSMVDMIAQFDSGGVFQYVSPSYERVLGYRPEDLVGVMGAEYVPPEDRESVIKATKDMLDKGAGSVQFRYRHKDGGYRWIESTGTVICDETGRNAGYVMGSRDITGKKLAEEALVRQRNELQMMLDLSPSLIFYKDRDNRFIKVNKALADLMEIPIEKMEGRTAFELFPEDAEGYWRDDLEVIKSGRPILRKEEPLRTPPGVRWVQTSKFPSVDERGNVTGVIGFSEDITERKRAEAGRLASEEQYRNLVESAPWSVIVHVDGKVMYCNPAAIRQSGYDCLDEMIGLPVMRFVHPDDRDLVVQRLMRQAATGEALQPIEERLITKSNEIIWVESSSIKHRFEGRDAILVFSRNITEEKKAEADILEVRERSIMEEMQSRRQHAQFIHDEYGGTLKGLSWHLDALGNTTRKLFENYPEADEILDKIRQINSFISSELERVTMMIHSSFYGYNEAINIVDNVLQFLERMEKKRSLDFTYEITAAEEIPFLLPYIASNLFYIVHEAIMNAIRHVKKPHIRIVFAQEGENFRLSISDNGPGFEGVSQGYGIRIMKYRAELIGGLFEMDSGPSGTSISCTVKTV